MKKVYLVVRILESPLSLRMMQPLKAFDDQAVAKDFMKKAEAATTALCQGKLIVSFPEGPKAVQTAGQFLADMGVAGFGYNVLELEVHGALILEPENRIIQ